MSLKVKYCFLAYIIIALNCYSQSESKELETVKSIEFGQNTPTKNEEARRCYNSGTDLMKKNDFVNAEVLLLKAIELDPNFADALDHLGIVYRRLNNFPKPIEMYEKSIEISPENKVAFMNLGLIYRQQRKYQEAFNHYKKVIEIDQNDPEGYLGAGSILQIVKQYEQSAKYLSAAIYYYNVTKSPYIYDALYLQAYNHYNTKDFTSLSKYIDDLITKFPEDSNLVEFKEEGKKSLEL